ncbi:MAG: orange carotenoid protein N-terminal domain-containing protein [Cyanophyceae cyanobacterium]
MTIQNIADHLDQAIQALKVMDVDSQLALLWQLFADIKETVSLGSEDMTGDDIASSLVERVKQKPAEEQLQALRHLVEGADTEVGEEYRSLSDEGKLYFWYFLAQAVESGSTVNIPFNYKLSSQAEELLEQLKTLELQKKIAFISSTVTNIGPQST